LEGFASEGKQSATTVVAAAGMYTGDRREGDVLDYRANGRVLELHRGDVVLAKVLWWRGMARGELSTRSRRRRRTVAVGDEAPERERNWPDSCARMRWS
jgi:hypothetical protein